MSFYTLLLIAQYSCLIPIAIGLIRFKKLPETGRFFFAFMIFCGFTEWFAGYLSQKYNNNQPFLYVFTLVEFGVFAHILIPRLDLLSPHNKKVFWGLLAFITLLSIADIAIHGIFLMNTLARVSCSVLIIMMSLSYVLQYIQSDSPQKITHDYIFWIAAGGVAYFSIAFFYLTMKNVLVKTNMNLAIIVTIAHFIGSILSYLLYAYSFWVFRPVKSINQPE